MNTIKFNNEVFEVSSYTKNTTFSEDSISSNGYCELVSPNIANLMSIAQDPITSIRIYHDNTQIYELENINAKIENINEYLSDDRISVNMNFIF